ARPAFSPAGDAVYFAGADGIRRFDLGSRRNELVAPGRFASGGVAVSPDGARLVYSDCCPNGPVIDLTRPERPVLIDDRNAAQPTAGPGGAVAWVHKALGASVLKVRRADGSTLEVTSPGFGTPSE